MSSNPRIYDQQEKKLYTASEHQAALALFARQIPSCFIELGRPDAECYIKAFHDLEDDVVIFKNSGVVVTAGDVRTLQKVILSLADPQALTAHDAALVLQVRQEIGEVVNIDEIGSLIDAVKCLKNYYEMDITKVEADNAALREQMKAEFERGVKQGMQFEHDECLKAQIASAEAPLREKISQLEAEIARLKVLEQGR